MFFLTPLPVFFPVIFLKKKTLMKHLVRTEGRSKYECCLLETNWCKIINEKTRQPIKTGGKRVNMQKLLDSYFFFPLSKRSQLQDFGIQLPNSPQFDGRAGLCSVFLAQIHNQTPEQLCPDFIFITPVPYLHRGVSIPVSSWCQRNTPALGGEVWQSFWRAGKKFLLESGKTLSFKLNVSL